MKNTQLRLCLFTQKEEMRWYSFLKNVFPRRGNWLKGLKENLGCILICLEKLQRNWRNLLMFIWAFISWWVHHMYFEFTIVLSTEGIGNKSSSRKNYTQILAILNCYRLTFLVFILILGEFIKLNFLKENTQ